MNDTIEVCKERDGGGQGHGNKYMNLGMLEVEQKKLSTIYLFIQQVLTEHVFMPGAGNIRDRDF